MKTVKAVLILLTILILGVLTLTAMCFAQPSGVYGGNAHGADPDTPVIEMARFVFASNGTLTSINELYLWDFSGGPCQLGDYEGGQPIPYTLFNPTLTVVGGAPGAAGFNETFLGSSQGCPSGSANQTVETLIVTPERSSSEFDYIIFGGMGRVVGHAIRK